MMLQDRVNKQKKSILIQTIIFFLMGSFFAVHLAKAATVEITIDTLPMVIEQMFTNINTDPFSVKENIGVIWIIYGLAHIFVACFGIRFSKKKMIYRMQNIS